VRVFVKIWLEDRQKRGWGEASSIPVILDNASFGEFGQMALV
jgi:hypothetical protein